MTHSHKCVVSISILFVIFLLFSTFSERMLAQCGCVPQKPVCSGNYYSGTKTTGSLITFAGWNSYDADGCSNGCTPMWQWWFDYHGPSSPNVNTANTSTTWTYTQPGTYTVADRKSVV